MKYYKLYEQNNNEWVCFGYYKTNKDLLSDTIGSYCIREELNGSYTLSYLDEYNKVHTERQWMVEEISCARYWIDQFIDLAKTSSKNRKV